MTPREQYKLANRLWRLRLQGKIDGATATTLALVATGYNCRIKHGAQVTPGNGSYRWFCQQRRLMYMTGTVAYMARWMRTCQRSTLGGVA